MSKKGKPESEAAMMAAGSAETIAEDLAPAPAQNIRSNNRKVRMAPLQAEVEPLAPAIEELPEPPAPAVQQEANDAVKAETFGVVSPATIVYEEVEFNWLYPSPLNFRRRRNPETIPPLAKSIVEKGLLHPLLCRPIPQPDPLIHINREIATGSRRHEAIGYAIEQGWLPQDYKVAIRVRPMTDDELVIINGVENFDREDTNEFDDAELFNNLRPRVTPLPGQSPEAAIGALFHISESTVWRRLRLLGAIPEVRDRTEAGDLTLIQAETLAKAPEEKQREVLAEADQAESEEDRKEILKPAAIRERVAEPPRDIERAATALERRIERENPNDDETPPHEPLRATVRETARLDLKALRKAIIAEVTGEFWPDRENSILAAPLIAEAKRLGGNSERHSLVRAAAMLIAEIERRDSQPALIETKPFKQRPDEDCIAEAWQVLKSYDKALRTSKATSPFKERLERIATEMNGGKTFGMKSPGGGDDRLRQALMAVADIEPLWGQPGHFEVAFEAAGDSAPLRVGVKTDGVFGMREFDFEVHALEPGPFISSTGFFSFVAKPPNSHTLAKAGMSAWVEYEINRWRCHDDKGKPLHAPRPLETYAPQPSAEERPLIAAPDGGKTEAGTPYIADPADIERAILSELSPGGMMTTAALAGLLGFPEGIIKDVCSRLFARGVLKNDPDPKYGGWKLPWPKADAEPATAKAE